MALAGTVTGSGVLLSESKQDRLLRQPGSSSFGVTETVQTEVREWPGLTEAAASAAVLAGTGEASMNLTGTGVVYSNAMAEASRVVGSYTYTVSAEKKTVTV